METLEALQNQVWELTSHSYKLTKNGKRYVMSMEGNRAIMVLLSSLSREESEKRIRRVRK